jgi:hypothetical protein
LSKAFLESAGTQQSIGQAECFLFCHTQRKKLSIPKDFVPDGNKVDTVVRNGAGDA